MGIRILSFLAAWLFLTVGQLSAQDDKAKEKKEMIKHIALLRVKLEQVKKGYKIAKKGLNIISNWTGGEYKLHQKFFKSLLTVNGNVKNTDAVNGIKDLQRAILKHYSTTMQQARASGMYSSAELDYFEQVFSRVLKDNDRVMDRMKDLTSNDSLEMTDDERLNRINALYADMQGNYSFCRSFGNDINLVARQREKQRREVDMSRELHGIGN